MASYVPQFSEPAKSWLRFIGLLVVLGLLCWLAYRLRAVFTPLLVAAVIAYMLNPIVSWLERVRRVPRLVGVIVTSLVIGGLLVGGGFYLTTLVVAQLSELQDRVPAYVQAAGRWINHLQGTESRASAAEPVSPESRPNQGVQLADPVQPRTPHWWTWAEPLLREHGVALAKSALNRMGAVFASAGSLLALLVLIPVFSFYFLWRFDDIVRRLRDHLPAAYRGVAVDVARTIDRAVADFFRGRLIVCLAVGVLTATGWTLAGVPYGLALGLLTGALNLVPFLSVLGLLPALLLTFLAASEAGNPWLWPAVWAIAVYMGVQALDSLLLGPAIVGRAAGLHPLALVLVLLIGAELGGLLGMLLAVPVASTLRTVAGVWVLPEIRRLAGIPGPPAPG